MYESFYGLKEKPFTLLPDPDYLYLSPKHQRALTLLEYGMMNQAGFSVICGDTGAGKTTLIRRLLTELGDDTKVGLITNTHQSFGELLNWVLMAFGLDGEGKSKSQMHHIFIDFLIEQYAQNKHTVLIVDEAQNMTADTLEELRMLSNINADKDQVLQVILAGQPALRETLRKPELMQFAQRIAVDYYLESLSAEETAAYIHHRLSVAGSDKTIFTDGACKAIFKYSGGTPRLINLLCDTALVYGFAEQSKRVDEKLVHDVVREQHSNSIIPTFNTSNHESITHPAEEEISDEVQVEKQTVETENKVNEQKIRYEQSQEQEKPQEQLQEKKIGESGVFEANAEITQQVTSAVNSVDQVAPVTHSETIKSVEPGKVNQTSSNLKDDTNVTPIKSKQADTNTGNINEQETRTINVEEALTDINAEDSDLSENSSEELENQKNEEKASDDRMGEVPPYTTRRRRDDEDVYPIVHIEDNSKKGLNMVLLGAVGGMFFASIIMLIIAWMMFGSKNNDARQVMQQNLNQQSQQEAENREIKTLQKERDAALAVTRALERERDAALTAAKAQEEIRAAELRASEILAEQELRAEKRLQEARARMRKAERAESKALARERELLSKTEKRQAEIEAEKLRLLRNERIRLEKIAKEEKLLLQEKQAEDIKAPVVEEAKEKPVEKPVEEKVEKEKEVKSFSANPCNSPSAKFLSTCKK